jgi:hypothetical protein
MAKHTFMFRCSLTTWADNSGTTRFALDDALKMHKEKPLSAQLEI